MKIAVLCSNGKVGRLVVKEALARGWDVTGIARHPNQSLAKSFVLKDIFDLAEADLKGYDAVVDAFGTGRNDDPKRHVASLLHIAGLLKGSPAKLYVVGGAGSLYVDLAHTLKLKDTPDFPKEYYPVSNAMSESLDELKKIPNVHWVYLSPAAIFLPDGKRTGHYRLGGEDLMVNAKGVSEISYADYALAMVNLIADGKKDSAHLSVIGE